MFGEEKTVPLALTSRAQYQALLEKLQKRTAYIMLWQICGEDSTDPCLQAALAGMELLSRRRTRKWPGTSTAGGGAEEYTFAADYRFFSFLRTFPSFFFNTKSPEGWDDVEQTEFGQDDIAFLDEKKQLLFFTTTHEGYAYILPTL